MWDVVIPYVNSVATRWAGWIVTASLDAALLLALIGLVWFAIRHRVAPQVGYCLFLLVPLKLLVPLLFVVTIPAGLVQWNPATIAASWFESVQVNQRIEDQASVVGRNDAGQSIPSAKSEPRSGSLPLSRIVPAEIRERPSPFERQPETQVRPIARSSADSMSKSPRLTVSAMALMAWFAGIVLLFGRFVHSQLRFRAYLRQAVSCETSTLTEEFRELCRLVGIRQSVRLVETKGIATPSVWGIARPTILMPQGVASTLTPQQLRWVLLHELAHVRRLDLIVVLLQRFVTSLHFFNPVIWVANRVIHQLREYACDDLASSLSQTSGVESGEAFVRMMRYVDRSRRGLEGAVGVFGLDSRACSLRRVRRLLDTDRPIRTAPGMLSILALILFAMISMPHLRAASEPPPAGSREAAKAATTKNEPEPKASGETALSKGGKEFELQVVGPDGKPIPEATLWLRSDPTPTAKQILRGKFLKKGPNHVDLSTDTEGRLVIELMQDPRNFNLFIEIPGYGPYWAGWTSMSHAQSIPHRLTAELESAWSVGGIVVDDAGKPVEGVTVRPSIEFKKRPGSLEQMGIGTSTKTDAAGRWHFDSVPDSMSEVHVEIDHLKFKPVRRGLARTDFGIKRGQEPTGKLVLETGLTVIGKVTDEAGKPIVDALVRTKFFNDIREARTGPDGVYRLAGCEPLPARIVVSAKGRATDMKEVEIEPEMGPVDFPMKPGGTVRVRVLDQQGHPVPKARIFFQRWRGLFQYFEFDHVSQYADKDGVWVWHEAPLDEFQADICPPDGMQLDKQPLIAREKEFVFRMSGKLVIAGNVIDAATKKPIKEFRVVPGWRTDQGQLHWNRRANFMAQDGHYEIRENRVDSLELIRIEADGYQAAVSHEIKPDEGTVTVDFELKRGKSVVAKVMTPDLLPAKGAKVALGIAGSQITIKNGEIHDLSTFCDRETTDGSGRFHFPAQDEKFQLVITHPSGFAHIKATPDWDLTRVIRLEPWSRVEGTLKIGPTLAAHAPLVINTNRVHSYGDDVANISTNYQASTGPDGRFVFERVIPGRGVIGREIRLTMGQGSWMVTSSNQVHIELPAGKTVTVDLGGTGRPVVGTLQPPQGFKGRVQWNYVLVSVRPADHETRATVFNLCATVDRDGKFRIDDVPEGDYVLDVQFHKDGSGSLRDYRLTVPSSGRKGVTEPIDLGTLRSENR